MLTTRETPQPDVSRSAVGEVDGYSQSVAGIQIEALRTGRGVGPNRVVTVRDRRFTLTSCDLGFPMLSRTTIGEDQVILAHVAAASPGSRWCEIDLFPGAVIAYGPGAEHTAVNRPGLRFSFAIAGRRELIELADRLEMAIELPRHGEVHLLEPSKGAWVAGDGMEVLAADAAHGDRDLGRQSDDVLRAMVGALAEPCRVHHVGCRPRIDSRHIVHEGIDYADAMGLIPSISELCLVSHVSERRLRMAYADEFDVSPTRFYRLWALNKARGRLQSLESNACTVSAVATDLGFFHLGRFAGYYRQAFGESPSDTIRARPTV